MKAIPKIIIIAQLPINMISTKLEGYGKACTFTCECTCTLAHYDSFGRIQQLLVYQWGEGWKLNYWGEGGGEITQIFKHTKQSSLPFP